MNNFNSSNQEIKLKFIDLFSGIGGFHQALTNLNFQCVFASEIDENCRNIYTLNYKLKPEGDIRDLIIKDIPSFDILCAGFPCQPFSQAGNQKGFDDTRGNLFFNICKIVKYHKPKYLILENVKNLASHDNGNTWKIIKKNIDELGYYTYDSPLILNSLYFGVPQSRERVVILCKRKDLGNLKEKPIINKKLIKLTSVKDIIDNKNNESYKIIGKLKITEIIWNNFLKLLKDNKILIPKFPLWTDWWDSDGEDTKVSQLNKSELLKSKEEQIKIIKEKRDDFYNKYKNWIDKNREFYKENLKLLRPWLIESRKQKLWKGSVRKLEWQAGDEILLINEVLWSPRGSGIRIKNLNYTPTLVAMTSMIPIYGPESRELTPRECARLQSFPDSFVIDKDDKQAYKQFGNAVNVKMIEKCANFLINDIPLFD